MGSVGGWDEWSRVILNDIQSLKENTKEIQKSLLHIEQSLEKRLRAHEKDLHKLELNAAKLGALSGVIVTIAVQVIITIFTRKIAG